MGSVKQKDIKWLKKSKVTSEAIYFEINVRKHLRNFNSRLVRIRLMIGMKLILCLVKN